MGNSNGVPTPHPHQIPFECGIRTGFKPHPRPEPDSNQVGLWGVAGKQYRESRRGRGLFRADSDSGHARALFLGRRGRAGRAVITYKSPCCRVTLIAEETPIAAYSSPAGRSLALPRCGSHRRPVIIANRQSSSRVPEFPDLESVSSSQSFQASLSGQPAPLRMHPRR